MGFLGQEGGPCSIFTRLRDIDRCQTYCKWEALVDGLYGYRQQDKVCDLKIPFKNKTYSDTLMARIGMKNPNKGCTRK